MFIDNYGRQEFSEFADMNGYELVDYFKKTKKEATFMVTLKVKGTQIEFDFMVKDYIFKCLTHRTYGLTEDITYAWQDYNTEKHGDLYSSCCSTGVKVLPF